MNRIDQQNWQDTNQQHLSTALALLKVRLKSHLQGDGKPEEDEGERLMLEQRLQDIARDMEIPPAIDTLAEMFSLSSFERDLLLLCAGVELDAEFASLCNSCPDQGTRGHPNFSLALMALADAHWSALMPDAPLRYWRLIEMQPGNALAFNALRMVPF